MKWLTFVRERFDPGSHFLMIFLFVAGHVTVDAVENKLDGALTQLERLPGLAVAPLGWIGLAAVVASLFLIDPTTPFPGLAALLPTLGTAAIIVAYWFYG